jgi:uncharacterized protein
MKCLFPILSCLFLFNTACEQGLSNKTTKKQGRQIYLHAPPDDPLKEERQTPIVPITNVHEHIIDIKNVPPVLAAMDQVGIEKVVVLGSPTYTFFMGPTGFTGHDANNAAVLSMAKAYPERIVPFVAVYPEDIDALAKLTAYIEMGAKGVKLFAGHGAKHGKGPFHTMPLDDPRLDAIYAKLEEENLPLLFHVNYGKFGDEFESLLQAHPNLKVLCPHFCLSLRDTRDVRKLLKKYPNLWMDVSFGWVQFQGEGFQRIDRKPDIVKKLLVDFPDRFTFGTDLVITPQKHKDQEWVRMNSAFYRDMLERDEYHFYGVSGGPLKGLALPDEVLTQIYRDNAESWLNGPPKGSASPDSP